MRKLWFGLPALAVLLLAVLAFLRGCRATECSIDVTNLLDEDIVNDESGQEEEVIYINTASPRTLRRAGFSYYQISQMVYLRSRGYAYERAEDLLTLPFADTSLINMLSPRLDFSDSEGFEPLSKLYVRWGGGDYDGKSDRYGYKRGNGQMRLQRIPLFAADSVTLAEAGMAQDAWDTLAAYQKGYVLRGSMALDSLASLPANELAAILRSKASPRRAMPAFEEYERKEYNIVELNAATREELMSLPGIGEKTADAIIDLRTRLGGFVSPRQLVGLWPLTAERYEGLKDYLTADATKVAKVNVNSANDTRMRRHPYFPLLLVARIGQLRLQGAGRRLTRADVERCVEGIEVSEFFWDYVMVAE